MAPMADDDDDLTPAEMEQIARGMVEGPCSILRVVVEGKCIWCGLRPSVCGCPNQPRPGFIEGDLIPN
jgi:hypothetical protein